MKKAVAALLLFECSAVAQVKPFQLGAFREEIIKEFGPTETFFAPKPNKYLRGLAEYQSAAGIWPRIDDVYMRETASNAYEVHLMYHFDSRESRLRPKQRVGRIELTVDKPRNFKLDDLPEVKSLCRTGCALYGIMVHGSLEILVYPTNPDPDLLALGTEVATGFKEDSSGGTWGIGIFLRLEEGALSRTRTGPPSVTQIEISPVDLQWELKQSSMAPVELGSWPN